MQLRGIAIVGNKHAGKSTVAAYLERRFLVRRSHPKELFGSMVSPIMLKMGVPIDELEARIFGNRIEEPLPDPFGHRTTRHLLQAAGGGFLEDFGVEGLAHMLTQPGGNGVVGLIESVRRPEEARWLQNNGWFLLRIVRPSTGGPTLEHATEVDLSEVRADVVVDNDGSLEDLLTVCDNVVKLRLGLRSAPRRHAILVLNGRPGVGKDACTEALRDMCHDMGIEFGYMSSIQPVKDLFAQAGIDVTRKTAADRDLLASTKRALQLHGRHIDRVLLNSFGQVRRAARQHVPSRRALLVTHIREHEEIRALAHSAATATIASNGAVHLRAAWVCRPGVADTGATNDGDRADASQYAYDCVVNNDGTLEDLRGKLRPVLEAAFAA